MRKLRMRNYAFLSPEQAEAVGLRRRRWGAALCFTDDDTRVTAVGDPTFVEMLIELGDGQSVDVPCAAFPMFRDGWPDDWAVDERIDVYGVVRLDDQTAERLGFEECDGLLCVYWDGDRPDAPRERRTIVGPAGFADEDAEPLAEGENDDTLNLLGWPEEW